MKYALILCSLLFPLAAAGGSNSNTTILTCFSCYTKTFQDNCNKAPTRARRLACKPSQKYCRVLREMDRKGFYSIKRSCEVTCREGCGVWGEEVDIERCHSCCTKNLCNIDNAASSFLSQGLIVLLSRIVMGWSLN